MLCPDVNIHILYNQDDKAMIAFLWALNWTQRLGLKGSVGLDGSREVRHDFEDIVIHKNIKPFTDTSSDDDFKKHSFHFESYCVDIQSLKEATSKLLFLIGSFV